mmetsp:Transcript_33302/g.85372  ORF Transcript_33302/g.85372 Transcript_33302/m.85372 type:complete len:142 (-) Transcript_33302:48-473(-)
MIYCFYLFDASGVLLYYEDWNRVHKPESMQEEFKLLFGLLFSMKDTVVALSPKQPTEGLHCFSTSTYKLHYLETPTGLRFVLMTDPSVPSLRECLKQIYTHIYVEHVVKNPAQKVGEPIVCTHFVHTINKYVRGLPYFLSG